MLARAFALASASFVLFACSSASDPASATGSDDVISGSAPESTAAAMDAKAGDACEATLVFLQKDAYKPSGRSSELWPPHTTTVLDVTCQTAKGAQHIAPYQENYGTPPGKKDANGNEMLVRVEMDAKVVTTKATWGEMKKLVTSFESCGCNPDAFLGLDTIDAKSKELVALLLPILTCEDPADAILLALKEKRLDDAKAMAARCRIKEGVTPEQLAETAGAVEREAQDVFAEHHVCNNNAVMQADLFARFRDKKDAGSCDAYTKKFCFGPKLFFSPKREIE